MSSPSGDVDRPPNRTRLLSIGHRFVAKQLPQAWTWAAPKLHWAISGDTMRWLPIRLSLHVFGMVGLAGLAAVTLWDFFAARFPSPLPAELKVDVVRLVMYVIAGLGGVIALVIAYRRQRLGEAKAVLEQTAESREQTKAFNEQFAAAAEQLSSDKAANRLAGVYAMASLADAWDQGRQTCINVLCAYIRMPYDPPEKEFDLETDDARKRHQEGRAEHQVRRTVMDVIGERLRVSPIESKTWHGHDFDFSGAVLDSGNLANIKVTGGRVDFSGAEFTGSRVNFSGAEFTGGQVNFSGAKFTGGRVNFIRAEFAGSRVNFFRAEFAGSRVDFFRAKFTGSRVVFSGAEFTGSQVPFDKAKFTGGSVDFNRAKFTGSHVIFSGAEFTGSRVDFSGAEFTGGQVNFSGAEFTGGRVSFIQAKRWDKPPVFNEFQDEIPICLLLPV